MKVVIVGGGKAGYYTAKTLLEHGCSVQIIELDSATCARIANELDASVLCADGTTVEALAQVGTGKIDVFVAVTGKDENNIVACEIAKRKFNVKKTIARANNPKNVEIMRLFGIDIAVSTTKIIAELIESEIDTVGLKMLATLNRGQAEIVDLEIAKGWKQQGAKIAELQFPKNCIIVAVSRFDNVEIPQGDTALFSGDHIIAVVDEQNRKSFEKVFK